MKSLYIILIAVLLAITSTAFTYYTVDGNTNPENRSSMEQEKIKITVNSQIFTATLSEQAAAKALKELLPMTISMTELNGNEKYYEFTKSFPANSSKVESIQCGDLMLYGSKTLVLFYQSFSTPYRYTKLGTINETKGLAAALGSGNVTITFELENAN